MAFNLENAVQQGFNRDVDSNDYNVKAQNLEVVLGDAGGGTEFRILDSDNVAIAVADSDGYLSIAGQAEVHGGHILVQADVLTNNEFITLQDQTGSAGIYLFDANPDGAYTANKGSFGTSYSDGYFYVNFDGLMQWERIALASQVPALANASNTLHSVYKNDLDGGDATITTDATDGDVIIAGTEQLRVTASGGFDVNTTGSFSLDADTDSSLNATNGNLTLSTTSTGDVIVIVPNTGGDFVVQEASGVEYLRAETVSKEMRLGSIATPILVRVLDDLVVDGDFTVNGNTTFVNTEDLYVEDRMVRLNVGAAPSFSGTTGIEAEVGSDGYVELHWDDADGRWEIGIDRSVTPEGQTFRPLPYLAANPAILDLSSTGDDGFPTAGPNVTGASIINTNFTNFPYSFGDYMADDSVQSALEAIDAYFIDLASFIDTSNNTTLHQAYKNDDDGGDAVITTDATDGAVVIAGTEKLQVTATGGIDLDTVFDMDGSTFDVDLSGAATIDAAAASNFTVAGADLTLSTTTSGDVNVVAASDVDIDGTNVLVDATAAISLDAGAASNFTTAAGALTLDGAGGIVLDGNGSNVRPAVDDTDSLGTASFGWTNVYMRSVTDTLTVGLSDAGSPLVHNASSGAEAIGTNPTNFNVFGSFMPTSSVQSALEAIDGYLASINSDSVTLHSAYKNDIDGGDAIITTDTLDGSVVIAGTESLWVTAAGGINLDSGFDMDATSSFDVEVTGAGFSLDAYSANSNISVSGADLVVETTTSGILTLTGATGVVIDGTGDNVRPAGNGTDTLGTSGFGWADIYLRNVPNTATVALRGAGDASAPNTTSGAHAVGTNASNYLTFGADMTDQTVQAALEAIDGYLATFSLNDFDTVYTRKDWFDINGAVLNGNVQLASLAGTPTLRFIEGATARAGWTMPVPSDWDGTSDINVNVIWSPSSNNTGDVAWRLEYKTLSLTEAANGATTDVDYDQAGNGTADTLQSTGLNLVIAAADISVSDVLIVVNLVRRGAAGADTFTGNAQVHLVQFSYSAQNIV